MVKKNNNKTYIKICLVLFVVFSIFYIVQVKNFFGIIKTEIVQQQEIERLKLIIEEGLNNE